MPRTITTGMQDHLSGQVLTLANCLRITRADGTVMGFTSFDQPLVIDTIRYNCDQSIKPSALRITSTDGVDNMEIVGLVSPTGLDINDLRGGRYNFADVFYFSVNWSDLTQGKIKLLTGKIGTITVVDGSYTAELQSLVTLMKRQVGRLTQYGCSVQRLGNPLCKVNIASYTTYNQSVSAVTSNAVFSCADSRSRPTGRYIAGIARFRTGLNTGLEREIKTNTLSGTTQALVLREEFPFLIGIGDLLDIEEGCNRLLSTCHQVFANTDNYRGLPHLPGSDRLVQTGRIPG